MLPTRCSRQCSRIPSILVIFVVFFFPSPLLTSVFFCTEISLLWRGHFTTLSIPSPSSFTGKLKPLSQHQQRQQASYINGNQCSLTKDLVGETRRLFFWTECTSCLVGPFLSCLLHSAIQTSFLHSFIHLAKFHSTVKGVHALPSFF